MRWNQGMDLAKCAGTGIIHYFSFIFFENDINKKNLVYKNGKQNGERVKTNRQRAKN